MSLIRPEARAQIFRWRECIAGAFIITVGVWLGLRTSGLAWWFSVALIAVGLLGFWAGLQRARIRPRSGGRGVMSQPLSRTANGGFATPSGDTRLATNNGTGKMQAAAFNKAPTTMGKPPMTRAQVAQRGGFGQTAASRSTGTRSVGG